MDNGQTWAGVASCHATNQSFTKAFHLTTYTPSAGAVLLSEQMPFDSDTQKDGIFGSQWRVRYFSQGQYNSSVLSVSVTPQP